MDRDEAVKLLIELRQEDGYGNPLYKSDVGELYKGALNFAIKSCKMLEFVGIPERPAGVEPEWLAIVNQYMELR